MTVPDPWMTKAAERIAASVGIPSLAEPFASIIACEKASEEIGGELADVRARIAMLDKQIEEGGR